MKYTIHIKNCVSNITQVLPYEVNNSLYYNLSYPVANSFFSMLYKTGKWDGRIKLYMRQRQEFNTGLLSKVIQVLNRFNIDYDIKDERIKPTLDKDFEFNIQLRNYQQDAVDCMDKYTRGLIKIATGGGKTLTFAGFIAKHNVPTLIVVPKLNLLNQTRSVLEKYLHTEVGIIGDGKCEPKRITVATIQSINKAYDKKVYNQKYDIIKQVVGNVNTLIIDESQHLEAKSVQFICNKALNAYYRFGFSATPFYNTELPLEVEKTTGRILIDINASKLIKEGYLSKPTIILKNYKHIRSNKEGMTYNDIIEQEIIHNNERNDMIIDYAMRYLKQGKKILIAVQRIDHGNNLLQKLQQKILDNNLKYKVEYINGKDESDTIKQVIADLDTGNINCVIATTILSEGTDIPNLDVLINCKGMESEVDTLQLIGRILRKTNTKDRVILVDIQDSNCKYLTAHAATRRKAYLTEDEFELIEE